MQEVQTVIRLHLKQSLEEGDIDNLDSEWLLLTKVLSSRLLTNASTSLREVEGVLFCVLSLRKATLFAKERVLKWDATYSSFSKSVRYSNHNKSTLEPRLVSHFRCLTHISTKLNTFLQIFRIAFSMSLEFQLLFLEISSKLKFQFVQALIWYFLLYSRRWRWVD